MLRPGERGGRPRDHRAGDRSTETAQPRSEKQGLVSSQDSLCVTRHGSPCHCSATSHVLDLHLRDLENPTQPGT